ncbi:MAG: hypothetical protein IPL79_16165 [Myxococcales bacterium]|nr:hypothetical protein [Myxococcales bacterium]
MTELARNELNSRAGAADTAMVKHDQADERGGYARRIADASQSIGRRLRELRRRVEPLKDATEVSSQIRQHPLAAAALALAGGVAVGVGRSGRTLLPSGLGALMGGLALQLGRTSAQSWLSSQLSSKPDQQ